MTRWGRFLRALVADPRAQRAVDETILDIRAEHTAAQSPWARASWLARSAMAVVRVSVRIVPFDLSVLVLRGWTLRVAGWATLLLAPMIVAPWMRHVYTTQSFGVGTQTLLFAALVPQGLAVVLPIALFLAAIWPPRGSLSPPVLQAVMGAMIVFLMILATPVANQVFRSVTYAALTRTTPSLNVPERGLRELTLGTLVQEGFGGQGDSRVSRRARALVAERTGLIAIAAVLALLGAFVRRGKARSEARTAPRPWRYALGMPALAFAGLAAFGPWGLWGSALVALALAIRVALRSFPPMPSPTASTVSR